VLFAVLCLGEQCWRYRGTRARQLNKALQLCFGSPYLLQGPRYVLYPAELLRKEVKIGNREVDAMFGVYATPTTTPKNATPTFRQFLGAHT
jgi:hypothetical protein